jgi:hypothetical protein
MGRNVIEAVFAKKRRRGGKGPRNAVTDHAAATTKPLDIAAAQKQALSGRLPRHSAKVARIRHAYAECSSAFRHWLHKERSFFQNYFDVSSIATWLKWFR